MTPKRTSGTSCRRPSWRVAVVQAVLFWTTASSLWAVTAGAWYYGVFFSADVIRWFYMVVTHKVYIRNEQSFWVAKFNLKKRRLALAARTTVSHYCFRRTREVAVLTVAE